MKTIKPSVEILYFEGKKALKLIEKAGRTCYKSEGLITEDSASRFVEMLVKRDHTAMIEHSFASVKIICDRACSHELVRHRLFSFAQVSQRYVNYSHDKCGNEITFILPCFFNLTPEEEEIALEPEALLVPNKHSFNHWQLAMQNAENVYFNMLKEGCKPEEARSVLPNSTMTEIVVSGNFREWRHFFKLRCDKAAHPQMREVANKIHKIFSKEIPEIFNLEK